MKPTVPNLNQTTWTALFWTKFEDRLLSGMHPVGPRHWHHGGDRGGAPPPLCSHDPRQGRSIPDCAPAVLFPRPKCPRRSPRLRISDPLHPRWPPWPVRQDKLAACCGRRSPAHWNSRRAHQCRRSHARNVAIAMAAVPKTGPDTRLRLALQLLLWEMSESMGNHDSEVVDASSVD